MSNASLIGKPYIPANKMNRSRSFSPSRFPDDWAFAPPQFPAEKSSRTAPTPGHALKSAKSKSSNALMAFMASSNNVGSMEPLPVVKRTLRRSLSKGKSLSFDGSSSVISAPAIARKAQRSTSSTDLTRISGLKTRRSSSSTDLNNSIKARRNSSSTDLTNTTSSSGNRRRRRFSRRPSMDKSSGSKRYSKSEDTLDKSSGSSGSSGSSASTKRGSLQNKLDKVPGSLNRSTSIPNLVARLKAEHSSASVVSEAITKVETDTIKPKKGIPARSKSTDSSVKPLPPRKHVDSPFSMQEDDQLAPTDCESSCSSTVPDCLSTNCCGCAKTWKCVCGEAMEGDMSFCGMCGEKKNWQCQSCSFARNLNRYIFCGNCGNSRNA